MGWRGYPIQILRQGISSDSTHQGHAIAQEDFLVILFMFCCVVAVDFHQRLYGQQILVGSHTQTITFAPIKKLIRLYDPKPSQNQMAPSCTEKYSERS